ncbi:response regulator [Alicyclobacillus fastidiosus]|uniref:Response regulator n=1 Tax=Alicyclobacillus fastidiosus TaxID=392011 RepID=A0ABY6ZIV8_9BACL|nr:response regulator [Alicyclobacillus fastidiosus]WAH42853.1 response regulator [Alicyclobacillus fastidiosus]GMA64788.1 hypothetical protein GCM10025859_52280 [Alicyclobacillus fastidiosus]
MKVRVLLVDDSREALELLELLYSFRNADVVGTALNFEQAKEIIERNNIDIISIDINMGEFCGFDLCRTVRRTRPNVFITMCSASDSEQDQRMANSCGAHYYLQKPIGFNDIDELMKAYFLWLAGHRT